MAAILTVTANPLLDHLATTTLTVGRVARVPGFTRISGGKGLNVARVLARFGHRVTACGFLGGASGAEVAALVAADGVVPAFTATTAATRIGFQAIAPTGGSTAVLEQGGPVSAAEQDALVATVAGLANTHALVIIGGAPPPGCDGLYARLLTVCRQAQVPCWIDGHGPAMAQALALGPDLVKPNRDEYGDGTGWQTAGELHLTDGGGGVAIHGPDGDWRVTPPAIVEVNPIGSGDCYLAALAHARLSGWDAATQWRWAAAAGAANAARADVAMIGPADCLPLLEQVVITADGPQGHGRGGSTRRT
jgi:tagatose 6-phosphate kinase